MTGAPAPSIDAPRLSLWVWSYARKFPGQLAAVLSLMGVGVVLNLMKPWPLVFLIDHVLRGRPTAAWAGWALARLPGAQDQLTLLTWTAAATVLIFLLDWSVGLATNYARITLGQRLTYRVATDLFLHLQSLSLLFHTRRSTGDNIRRVTTDCASVTTIFRDALLPLVTAAASLILMFSILWRINGTLTVLALLVAPFMILAFRLYAQPMLERGYDEDDAEGRIYGMVEQTFSAMPAVKAFGREMMNEEQFHRRTRGALSAAVASLTVQLKFKIMMELATAVGSAAILWFGARAVISGEMTVGSIILFLSYLASLYAPLEAMMYTGSTIQTAGGGALRVLELLRVEPEVSDRADAVPLARAEGRLEFEQVSFGYEEGRPILREVSLRVEPGETVALVGPTGAGKTTLVSLIPRFFDPSQGRVLLDGHDLREVRLADVRRQVALVLQEPFLFPLSLVENIAYGRPEASAAEIEAAARAANAHDFISRLPEGYQTVIGERGATLSGGERQRLSIARALLKDAPVLILDEPTSALDAGAEALIMDALRTLVRGRTTFIIAHRLATVQNADRILVLDQGRIVETGTHHELVRNGGLYARYSALQFGPQPQPALG